MAEWFKAVVLKTTVRKHRGFESRPLRQTRRHRLQAPARARREPGTTPAWAAWEDDRLLSLRLCDLDLRLEGSPVQVRIDRLLAELRQRGLRFRPHFWLSDEWFSPDGVAGIAVPFYLAHPRLARLERRQMLEVEGWGRRACMRILRHEAGHALAHAWQLHRRPAWRAHFGSAARPYPEVYRPRPISKRFVHHLDHWYAQSHPDEDWAETFAVWLGSAPAVWRRRYEGWPARRKLEYVESLMEEIGSRRPSRLSRRRVDPLPQLGKTLRQHYRRRRAHYAVGDPDLYDDDLRRVFSDAPEHQRRRSASAFIRRRRSELRTRVARFSGQVPYTVDQVLKGMEGRCRALRLRLPAGERQALDDFAVLLTVHTMNGLLGGRRRMAL